MTVIECIANAADCHGDDVRVDAGMDIFNKFIEKSGMEKKSYQYDGVKWLVQNELRHVSSGDFPYNMRGGIVADEMGLGKTIMMIGLCLANFMHNRKTLIVLPPVLIEQWYAQIYRTTGHKCAVYHGKNKKKFDAKVNVCGGVDSDPFLGAVIVLCSYDAVSIFREKTGKRKVNANNDELDKNRRPMRFIENSLLHRIKWGRVIFDEAHHLRNKNTTRYIGAKLLVADVKWLVTGTPVQNRKQDFYALCSLINLPASYYTDPVNFNEIGHAFILKRTKHQVGIDLIDAVQNKKIVQWKSDAEKKFSEEIHSLIAFTNVNMSETNENGIGVTKGLLPLLLKARQSCIYPKMVKANHGLGVGLSKEAINTTSKLDSVIDAILERKDNGNGKLVFCHFKEEMNELAVRLRGIGLNVGILDGQIAKGARQKLLKEGKDVLILQIQTGCEGLNLQDNYSEIYFVSPHWNPYVEDQAIARCHRIGQRKPVFVWRFEMNNFDYCSSGGAGGHGDRDVACNIITARTKNLEEYVIDVQNLKRNIVRQIIIE
jgi:SNF2 family DNA or RNA helicase